MVLLHYSAAPLGNLRSRVAELGVDRKPKGVWVSVDEAWKEWCESEEFALPDLAVVSEITLKPDASIYWLRSPAEIDLATTTYSAPLYRGSRAGVALDWRRIAETYDAIIIAPYQWRRRLADHCSWYYGWDCASGCIWHPRAIAAVRPAVRSAA